MRAKLVNESINDNYFWIVARLPLNKFIIVYEYLNKDAAYAGFYQKRFRGEISSVKENVKEFDNILDRDNYIKKLSTEYPDYKVHFLHMYPKK